MSYPIHYTFRILTGGLYSTVFEKNKHPSIHKIAEFIWKYVKRTNISKSFYHLMLLFADIDECMGYNHGCSHYCVNFPGGYHCACPTGWHLNRLDGKDCISELCFSCTLSPKVVLDNILCYLFLHNIILCAKIRVSNTSTKMKNVLYRHFLEHNIPINILQKVHVYTRLDHCWSWSSNR